MRRLAFVLAGLSLVGWQALGGCGSDVTSDEPPATTTAAGGSTTTITTTTTTTSAEGGSGGTSTGSTTSTSSTAQGGAGGMSVCEQACDKVENECNVPNGCASVPGGMFDCAGDPAAGECNGQCVLAAECDDLYTLATATPDPEFSTCLQGCMEPCEGCVFGSCWPETFQCYYDETCQLFLQCLDDQGCTDYTCVEGCLNDNPSDAASALALCTCDSCSPDCGSCG